MNIEFGCGANPTRAGYKTCDIRNLSMIDYVCSAVDIDKHVEPNSVASTFSRHMFEHLSFIDGKRHLEACYKILQPTGVYEMMLPNMDFHVAQWLTQNPATMDHARAGFWGWQREAADGEIWDMHRSGYNLATIRPILDSVGFHSITSLKKPTHKHLWITCKK